MNNEAYLYELTGHMTWADSKLWQSVLAIENVEIEDRIRELFYHIHVVQQVYFQLWTGKEIAYPDLPEFHDLQQILKWGNDYSTKVTDFVAIINTSQFAEILSNPWKSKISRMLGQDPEDVTVGQSIIQVTSHSCYHRAQINSCIRELGGEPAKLDFITWVWLGKPKPEWDNILVASKL